MKNLSSFINDNLIAVIGLVAPIFAFFTKYLFFRPKMTIELIFSYSGSSPRHTVKYVLHEDDPNAFDPRKSVKQFELTWNYTLKIRNISNQTARDLRIDFHNNSPILNFVKKVNPHDLIKGESEIEFEVSFKLHENRVPSERSDSSKLIPEIFKDLNILLTYKDTYGMSFYSVYQFKNKSNKFKILKPIRYNNLSNFKPPLDLY